MAADRRHPSRRAVGTTRIGAKRRRSRQGHRHCDGRRCRRPPARAPATAQPVAAVLLPWETAKRSDNCLLSGTSGHDARRGPGNGRAAVCDSDMLSGKSVGGTAPVKAPRKPDAIHGPRRRPNLTVGHLPTIPDGLLHSGKVNIYPAGGRPPGEHSWLFCALEPAYGRAEVRASIRRSGRA